MLLGIVLCSAVILVDAATISAESSGGPACQTNDCISFAREIVSNLDPSADPCVDFYKFACGNWNRHHPLPVGEDFWTMRMISERENRRKVQEMLTEDIHVDEIPSARVTKGWYKACTNTENMNKRGMEPVLSVLRVIGGWPITMSANKWNEGSKKWQDIDDYYAHLSGTNLLHDARVASDPRNPKLLTAVVDIPDMPEYTWMLDESSDPQTNGEEQGFRVNEKYREFVETIALRVASAEGSDLSRVQLENDIENLLNFTWKLSKITILLDNYVNTTVRDFQKWYNDLGSRTENSKVNWEKKIIGIFRESGIDLSPDTIVKVSSPGYFEKLVPLLDETSDRTIVNYLHWNFVSHAIKWTTDDMRELLGRMIDEERKNESRSDFCIEEAQMNDVIAYQYVKKYFANSTIRMAQDAIDDMKKEIEIEIDRSNWASEEIKNLSLRRIGSVKRNIGYPDWYNNDTYMGNYFGDLTMGPTYFENALKLQRHRKSCELRRLGHRSQAEPWLVDPLKINAYYLSESNSITVPLVNLQAPFFSGTQPNTINYALAGFLMAHELYHPFDELKRLYNEYGVEITWPKNMTRNYYKSAECFVNQFNDYTLDGSPVGPKVENYGTQNFDENMADTMGLKAAFKAYKRRETINGRPEMSLPQLEWYFTNDQIFFLSYANSWCETRDADRIVTDAKLDMHSLPRLRAIGSLSNNQDFANAFSCPVGSPMNPANKCNIWQLRKVRSRQDRDDIQGTALLDTRFPEEQIPQ